MSFGKFFSAVTVVLAVVGCTTIYNAQMAQQALEGKGLGAEDVRGGKVDLRDYSLKELVDFAMTNRPSVAAAALEVADARLALKEVVADAPLVSAFPWNAPHLSLSGGYSALSETSPDSNGLRWQTEGNASAALSLQVLLYDFGRNNAQANAQVERVIAAEQELVREGYAVFDEVASAYFTLLQNDALLAVALTNETEFAVHLQEAQERLDAGEAQRLDVVRARAELSQAKENTIAKSNLVVTSGASLMRALGIDAARGTREEVYPPDGNALSTLTRGFAKTDYDVQAAYQLARTNAPAVSVARARLRAASHAVDYAVADLMPSVSAEVGISWADPLWTWHWGVSAVQSVFQGFRKVTAVDRAVVQMHVAATGVDEVEQQLSLELQQEIAVRDNAVKAWETARATVRAAREELKLAKARYLEGDASRVDFTDAVSHYATALGSRVQAFYAAQMAEAKLFATTGVMPTYWEESTHAR